MASRSSRGEQERPARAGSRWTRTLWWTLVRSSGTLGTWTPGRSPRPRRRRSALPWQRRVRSGRRASWARTKAAIISLPRDIAPRRTGGHGAVAVEGAGRPSKAVGVGGDHVLAEGAHAARDVGELRVVGDEDAALPARQVLARLEREAARVRDGAHRLALVRRAVGLRRVLDDDEVVLPGDLQHLVEIAGVAVDVDGHEGPRARGEGRLDGAHVDVAVLRVDVDEHGDGADLHHREGGRHERVGGDDDFVALAHAQRRQRHREGARPAVGELGVRGAGEGGELALQGGGLRREHAGRG